ncbi:MAG: aminoglycoside phosphotransferase family protein [Lachnospiraceae bacterium]|nr:aminoglycoside phosphotransferase family protein [Lachnospiraceae bacterium]
MKDTIERLLKQCGLGDLAGDITPVSGGLMHRMYKVQTEQGTYAVKHLNPTIMKRSQAMDNYKTAEALEAVLEANRLPVVPAMTFAGKKMQELDGDYFYIYRWQQGSITDWNNITAEQCRKAGEILGRIHAIDSSLAEPEAPEIFETDFTEYAQLAAEKESPVAEVISDNLELLRNAKRKLNNARRSLPSLQCICDDDMDPKNVMWYEGNPYVIDLECLSYGNPVASCMDLSLQWAGIVNGKYSRDCLIAFHKGYRSAFDNGFRDYDQLFGIAYTWLEWLEYNVRRALGLEGNGEEALGESEVRNTIGRIRYLSDLEEEICETLRSLT